MRLTFSKRVRNFGTRLVRKLSEKDDKLVRSGPQATVLGISKCKIDRRRFRNVLEPLQTPKTAIKDEKSRILGPRGLGGGLVVSSVAPFS